MARTNYSTKFFPTITDGDEDEQRRHAEAFNDARKKKDEAALGELAAREHGGLLTVKTLPGHLTNATDTEEMIALMREIVTLDIEDDDVEANSGIIGGIVGGAIAVEFGCFLMGSREQGKHSPSDIGFMLNVPAKVSVDLSVERLTEEPYLPSWLIQNTTEHR